MTANVLCIGVANVDIIAYVDVPFLARHRVDKNTSTLMKIDDIRDMIAELKDGITVPGGCAANTACGTAAQGVATRFCGMTGADDYGAVFCDGFKPYGVAYDRVEHPDKHTALCLTLVTPDKDRSFVFSPDAASWFLSEHHLPDSTPESIIYTEANLLRMTAGTDKTSMLHAVIDKYGAHGNRIVLNLIDTEITERHRQTLKTLIRDGCLSVIISNHEELMALFPADTLEESMHAARETGQIFLTTLGRDGVALITHDGIETIPGLNIPMEDVIDTVGAGDQFAAGVLAAMAQGDDLSAACAQGGQRASEILEMIGARPNPAITIRTGTDAG